MKIVLDTNIWLDYFIFKDIKVINLFKAIENKQILCFTCHRMHNELKRVLSYPQFIKYHININECLIYFNQYVIYLDEPHKNTPVKCKDRDDQIFLDFCYTHHIEFLLSKDKQVLKLAKNMKKLGVQILNNIDFNFKLNELVV